MKKIIVLLMLSVSFMFAALNLQTATKDELMSIKGIGPVKADRILKYRKSNTINSADDLQNIKGFGSKVISNVKSNNTVSKRKMIEKKKREKVEDKRKAKIEKLNAKKGSISKEKLKAKKAKVNAKAKERKKAINEKVRAKTKEMKEKKKARKEAKNK